jgi:Spy/CpxP family protein refolding chaperone
MRRLFGITIASLVACLILNSAAMAQQGRGGRGGRGGFGGGGFGGGGLTFLLQNPQVQKELKLSEDQIAKVKEVADAARPAPGAGGGRRGGADQTDEQRAAAREERQKRTAETDKKLTDLLTADQNARLKQVQLWVQGTRALTSNETVAKELSLTDDQKSALKTISDESGKKGQELFTGLGRGASDEQRTKAREQMTALQKETEAECLAVLTDDQKAKFATMKGEKFQLDMTQLGGRGGRGGRAGNNNNN